MSKLSQKGFIFAGCSFTYGYGLNFYSPNFHGDYKNPYGEISSDNIYADLLYQESKRFSNQVANHYKTFHIQPERLSGSDIENLDFLKSILKDKTKIERWWEKSADTRDFTNVNYDSFHTLIFQTSYFDRSITFLWNDILKHDGTFCKSEEEALEYQRSLPTELQSRFYSQLIKKTWRLVKQISEDFESNGIKVYYIHADDRYQDIPDSYLKERTIKIEYENTEYFCLNDLHEGDLKSRIAFDTDFFGDNPPEDYHPTPQVHDAIANSIIKRLNEDN